MPEYYNYPRYKVAAVQASSIVGNAPHWFDLEATLDKAVSLITEAGKNGARLVVFPECWLPCFPYWCYDFSDPSTFREIWANFLWSSVEVPSQETEALCRAAKKADTYVVMGINERDKAFQGRMYNSILYLNPRGEIMGTHRKIANTFYERLYHTPGDGGDNLKTVFKTGIGNIGGSICGEHSQLTLIYNWIMQGIQIHCSLWPGLEATREETDIRTRGVCWAAHAFGVLSATYIPEKDMPKKFYKNSTFNIPGSLRGGSGVISPSGKYIAGPVYDEETIVYGDIDLKDIDKTRFAVNLTGYYSRWDLLSLNVRQETYEPLVPMKATEGALPASESNRIKDLEAQLKQLEQQIAALSSEMGKDISHKK